MEEGKLAHKEKIDKSVWWLLLKAQILHYQVTGIQLFFQLGKLTKCPLQNTYKCHPKAEYLKNPKSEKGHFPPSVAITVGPNDSSRNVYTFDD